MVSIKGVFSRIAELRGAIFGAAVFLVLVPTVFAVFPECEKWADWVRACILLAWILVALLAGWSTALQGQRIEQLAGGPLTRREKLREAAVARLIRALLLPDSSGFPEHYEFRLFLLDESSDRMVPAFASTGFESSQGWARGQGATGLAWNANSRVLIRGAHVADATYGLTAEQQARYSHLAVVAAMPVRTARDRVIGVLAVSSATDDGFLDGHEAVLAHVELSGVVGRLLVDMLGGGRE